MPANRRRYGARKVDGRVWIIDYQLNRRMEHILNGRGYGGEPFEIGDVFWSARVAARCLNKDPENFKHLLEPELMDFYREGLRGEHL